VYRAITYTSVVARRLRDTDEICTKNIISQLESFVKQLNLALVLSEIVANLVQTAEIDFERISTTI
jgi:hypothetical protein